VSPIVATKRVSGVFSAGGTVTYTVTITNDGAAPFPDLAGPEFEDTLASELSVVSTQASAGDVTANGNRVSWSGSLPGHSSVTLTIVARIAAGSEGRIVSNQGLVYWDLDGDGGSDAVVVTDDPDAPGGGERTAFQVPWGAASFFTVEPCRLVDTRRAAGPRGGPALAAGTDRAFGLAGACGLPPAAKGVVLNVAVTQPTAAGELVLHAAGTSVPGGSSIHYRAGQTRSNHVVVPLDPAAALAVFCNQGSGTAHLVLDVTGYFE
jgi:uncharacterized repeat protein (TIGR01451 family)